MKKTINPILVNTVLAKELLTNQFKVKAILIDLDGTMINTAPEIARAANAMLAQLNLPALPHAQVQAFIGDGATALITRCLTESALKAPDLILLNQTLLNQAQTVFFEEYALVLTESVLYPTVESSLKRMKEVGFPLACVTNKPAQFTVPLLKATGLFDYFNMVVCGDTLPKKKPAPDQIDYVCQTFGVAPWETVLIGDSNTDILAAKNAGCYVFTVPYGYNQGLAIDENNVDAMIENLSETFDYIEI